MVIAIYVIYLIIAQPWFSLQVESGYTLRYVELEVLISFEAWAKLAQQWFVCTPLGIHLEPINEELMR